MIPSQPSDPWADGHATQHRVATQDPDIDIHPVTEPAAPSTSARSDVAESRHAVVSVINNLRQFFHNNLSNLFVLYLTGSLPCDCREVGEPSQPRGGHVRHINT